MKKYFLIIQIVLACTILSICYLSIVAAEPINSILTGWRITKNLSIDLNLYNECKRVVSPSGMDVFVPTKNQQEWNSFKLGAHALGVTLVDCPPLVALPTLSVTRTPNNLTGNIPNTPFTLSWSTTGAVGSIKYICLGGRPRNSLLPLSGTSNATYLHSDGGRTECTWTITGPGGSQTLVESFIILAPPTYRWQSSLWGSCSVSCGVGTQTRDSECIRNDGVIVLDSLCTSPKPVSSQICQEWCVNPGNWGQTSTGTDYLNCPATTNTPYVGFSSISVPALTHGSTSSSLSTYSSSINQNCSISYTCAAGTASPNYTSVRCDCPTGTTWNGTICALPANCSATTNTPYTGYNSISVPALTHGSTSSSLSTYSSSENKNCSLTFSCDNSRTSPNFASASCACPTGTSWDGSRCTLLSNDCSAITTTPFVGFSSISVPALTHGSTSSSLSTYSSSKNKNCSLTYTCTNRSLSANQASVVCTCSTGTSWDGEKCKPIIYGCPPNTTVTYPRGNSSAGITCDINGQPSTAFSNSIVGYSSTNLTKKICSSFKYVDFSSIMSNPNQCWYGVYDLDNSGSLWAEHYIACNQDTCKEILRIKLSYEGHWAIAPPLSIPYLGIQ